MPAAEAAREKQLPPLNEFVVQAFEKFKSREDELMLLRAAVLPEEASKLEEYLAKRTFVRMPAVTTQNGDLIFKFKAGNERLRIVDAGKSLFRLRGIEIDLSRERPIADRLRQVEELLKQPRHASKSNKRRLIFPEANAADSSSSSATAIVAVTPIVKAHTAIDIRLKLKKIKAVCEHMMSWAGGRVEHFALEREPYYLMPLPPGPHPAADRTASWLQVSKTHLSQAKSYYCSNALVQTSRHVAQIAKDMYHHLFVTSDPNDLDPWATKIQNENEGCDNLKGALVCLEKLPLPKARVLPEQSKELSRIAAEVPRSVDELKVAREKAGWVPSRIGIMRSGNAFD